MPYKKKPRTPDAYSPEYRLFHKALSSKTGLKLKFHTRGQATNYRQRLNLARVIWREHMAKQIEEGRNTADLFDDTGGLDCPFDILVITVTQDPRDHASPGKPDALRPAELYITKEPLGVSGLVSVTFRDTGEDMDLTPKISKETQE